MMRKKFQEKLEQSFYDKAKEECLFEGDEDRIKALADILVNRVVEEVFSLLNFDTNVTISTGGEPRSSVYGSFANDGVTWRGFRHNQGNTDVPLPIGEGFLATINKDDAIPPGWKEYTGESKVIQYIGNINKEES